MIEKMTKYSFILLSREREAFLSQIQELGVLDITRSAKPVDDRSMALMRKVDEARATIATLQKGEDAQLLSLTAQLRELEKSYAETLPWGAYDRDKTGLLSDLGYKFHYYIVPKKAYDPVWEENHPLQKVCEQDGRVYFVVVGDDTLPVKEIPAPARTAQELQVLIDAKKNEIEAHRQGLVNRREEIPQIEADIRGTVAELNRYLAGLTGSEAAENTLCVFEGFAPAQDKARLERAFDEMDIYWQAADASVEDNPPIKLKNNLFSRLFEGITGMYGMPVYNEFDPTPLLSIFFLLFFAMCMGDGGYGIVLILAGIAIHKKWLKIKMFENIGPLISVLGVATFIVGILMGTFFGIDLRQAEWVPQGLKNCMISGQIAGYDAQMVLALIIGVLHICLAMIFKTIFYIKRFGFKNSISTLGWTTLVVGGVLIASLAMLKFLPPTVIKWMVIGLAVLSGLGIFIFNKPGRNPLLNIGAGLWDSYQMVTGIMGDVLSYIRLYALGLAGGLLGAAFNNLGGMVLGQNPTWQWLPFVLILIIGHVLNLLMSCLGAFVHPLRLNFVEFFKNSGYEGRGLKYNPLKK